ncbi:sigma-70 family RNA polymerase sigma factor [Nakamurella antarctica]|uniref:Sigma-70 family RNA polymerase sigma factor n=1 Tax=Nakamurella antarctica TaxID=1902245 RepID=A0A3G8ZW94_9ACTN|nr:sigma-70 family RNA polymerase sigma factor [Nakamurella antarctica]AZI58286.1 sigma-70 family RNA polymerase sigma factor [Nakamurella antarctica]
MPDENEDWFNNLFQAHSEAVFRYFVRRAPVDDAQDLTADVFVIAWRRRNDVPADSELPWLYKTAGYLLANYRRKGRAIPLSPFTDSDFADVSAETSTVHWSDNSTQVDEIAEVLQALSAKDRQILLLSAWEGLSGNEIAGVLGISRSGADAALSRARARLRSAWAVVDAH